MISEYYLMLEDQKVVYFNFDDVEVDVINRDLLPFVLREKIVAPSIDDIRNYYKVNSRNLFYIKEYISSRVLSLSRDNAKQIYAACNISQDNSMDNRVDICLNCKGVSLYDAYWFKSPDSSDVWENVDLKHRHLSEIVDVALLGLSPTVTADPLCPELTTKGLFRKAWIREDGELYLLKSDRTSTFINTQAELLASRILDCSNVEHVNYEKAEYSGIMVSKCRNFISDGMSFVEAHEVMSFCRDVGIDFVDFVLEAFGSGFANIPVVDYILQNTDRHDQNYGFIMDNRTGKLCSVAPLFDHNQALVADFMNMDVTDTLSQMLNRKMTLKETLDVFVRQSAIEFNRDKYQLLKREYPEYSNILDRVEFRVKEIEKVLK